MQPDDGTGDPGRVVVATIGEHMAAPQARPTLRVIDPAHRVFGPRARLPNHYPQTSPAVSTTSRSLATWSS